MLRRVMVIFGFVLHLAVGVWVLLGGLIMPPWAVLGLFLVWAAAVAVAVRWRDRPAVVLAVPVAVAAVWFLAAWAGDTFLGWTA